MTAKQDDAAFNAAALVALRAASAKRIAARSAADIARTANTASDAAWDADVAEYRARGVWTALQAAAKAARAAEDAA